jgi:hypothetical protein
VVSVVDHRSPIRHDFVASLLHSVDPVAFARDRLGWQPDEAQQTILDASQRRIILNWGRQSGKSTLAAVKMLHVALEQPGSLGIWVSSRKEHTAEVFQKIDAMLMDLAPAPVAAPRGIAGKQIARRLPNGSQILGLAPRDCTVRSYTADLVVLDEAGQMKDAVFDAITPTLAVRNGTLWVLGTPQGKKGRFWEIWSGMLPASAGDSSPLLPQAQLQMQLQMQQQHPIYGWFRSQRTTAECGRVSAQFLAAERWSKGDIVVRREYECEFVDDGLTLLREDDVDFMFQK